MSAPAVTPGAPPAATTPAPLAVEPVTFAVLAGAADEGEGRDELLSTVSPESARFVQHLGTWLMIGMVARLGLHAAAGALRAERVAAVSLRIALDAVVAGLSIGERCVEGVRRLATSSGAALLLATRPPSATWVRATLGRFAADGGGMLLHLGMGRTYLEEACAEDGRGEPTVFYVDNHVRHYTGKFTLRLGWRMQDKRAVPGTSDYYVHDEDGRPVVRGTVPSHESLPRMLLPIVATLRLALDRKEHFLLAFDRGGAFPEAMLELRTAGVDFVTYERAPLQPVARKSFTPMTVDGEEFSVYETRANLGDGRGRVRRICVLLPDGRQLNLLAISELPAERLLEIMRGRWKQENGLKHGAERWGINPLDGRKTVEYPAGTTIPNPARRRLNRALRLMQAQEGELRRKRAKVPKGPSGASRRNALDAELEWVLAEQRQLEAQRPLVPEHAPIEETELAGELVHHALEYKTTLDTVRIACLNAEAALAAELGAYLPQSKEAKRALKNLFGAPGRIRVDAGAITAELAPAGTKSEMCGYAAMLETINEWQLTLPGDPLGHPLRFRLQL
jgi:hypothetical protein